MSSFSELQFFKNKNREMVLTTVNAKDSKENGFIDYVKSDVYNLFIKLTFNVLFFTSE